MTRWRVRTIADTRRPPERGPSCIWWPGAESNHRHADFQSRVGSPEALYFKELPGRPLPNLQHNAGRCIASSRKSHAPVPSSGSSRKLPLCATTARPGVEAATHHLAGRSSCPSGQIFQNLYDQNALLLDELIPRTDPKS